MVEHRQVPGPQTVDQPVGKLWSGHGAVDELDRPEGRRLLPRRQVVDRIHVDHVRQVVGVAQHVLDIRPGRVGVGQGGQVAVRGAHGDDLMFGIGTCPGRCGGEDLRPRHPLGDHHLAAVLERRGIGRSGRRQRVGLHPHAVTETASGASHLELWLIGPAIGDDHVVRAEPTLVQVALRERVRGRHHEPGHHHLPGGEAPVIVVVLGPLVGPLLPRVEPAGHVRPLQVERSELQGGGLVGLRAVGPRPVLRVEQTVDYPGDRRTSVVEGEGVETVEQPVDLLVHGQTLGEPDVGDNLALQRRSTLVAGGTGLLVRVVDHSEQVHVPPCQRRVQLDVALPVEHAEGARHPVPHHLSAFLFGQTVRGVEIGSDRRLERVEHREVRQPCLLSGQVDVIGRPRCPGRGVDHDVAQFAVRGISTDPEGTLPERCERCRRREVGDRRGQLGDPFPPFARHRPSGQFRQEGVRGQSPAVPRANPAGAGDAPTLLDDGRTDRRVQPVRPPVQDRPGLFFGGAGSEHRAVHWSWGPVWMLGVPVEHVARRLVAPQRRAAPGLSAEGENLAVPGVISHRRGTQCRRGRGDEGAAHPSDCVGVRVRVGQLVERKGADGDIQSVERRQSVGDTFDRRQGISFRDLVGVHPGESQGRPTLEGDSPHPVHIFNAVDVERPDIADGIIRVQALVADPHADIEVGLGEQHGDDARRRVQMVPGTDRRILHFFEREQPVAEPHPVRRDRRCHRDALAHQGRCDGGHGNGGVGQVVHRRRRVAFRGQPTEAVPGPVTAGHAGRGDRDDRRGLAGGTADLDPAPTVVVVQHPHTAPMVEDGEIASNVVGPPETALGNAVELPHWQPIIPGHLVVEQTLDRFRLVLIPGHDVDNATRRGVDPDGRSIDQLRAGGLGHLPVR